MTLLMALLACGGGGEAVVDASPEPIGLHECAVCGMVVGEQPSPRGQVVHRDGEHRFVCSLGEVRAYLQTPNPAGKPVAVYVEALPAEFDPASTDSSPLPWVSAEDASYVFGAKRPTVMGLPVLSFADSTAAEAVASRLSTHPVDWAALIATPFDQPVP